MPSLSIDIEARLAKFQDGLDQVVRSSGKAADQIDSAFSGVRSTLLSLGVGLSVGAIAGAIRQTVVQMGDLNDSAAKAGISVESLSSLLNTLKPTGVGMEQIVDVTGKLVRSMGQAQDETSKQARAFAALGVSIKDSAGNLRNADDVLGDIAGAFEGYRDGANKVALAQALLTKSGAEYLPMLSDLATRTRAAASVTKEQAQAADDLGDQIRELGVQYDILKQKVVGSFLPGLLAGLERFNKLNELTGANIFQRARVTGAFAPGDLSETNAALAETDAKIAKTQATIDRLRQSIAAKEGAASGGFLSDLFSSSDVSILKRNLGDVEETLGDLQKRREYLGLLQKQAQPREAKADTRKNAPSGFGESATKALSDAARSFEDFEARVNAAVAKLLEDTPIVKARELTSQLGKLDELFRLGVDPGIYGQAVGSALTNMAQSGGDASLAISELYKRFGAGKISAGQFAETLEAITKITDKIGKEDKDTLEQLANKWRDLIDPTRKYLKELEEIKLLEGTLSGGELQRALDDIQRRRSEEAEKTNDVLKEQTDIAKDLGLTFSSAFEDAISGGKGLRDIISGIESDIIKLVTRQLVTKPFASWMESALPSILGSMSFGSGAPISASVASTVIPRAAGGPVSVGGSYLVGERAPELFVPKVAGDIVPIGLGGTSVQMTVVTQDAESFRRSEGQIASRLSGALSRGGRFR